MNDILLVARNHLLMALRERITLFWFMIFPVFLLVILAVIFGHIGQEGEISFGISLLNLDRGSSNAFSTIVEETFAELAQPQEQGKEPLFALMSSGGGEDPDAYIEAETLAVKRGRRTAFIIIPEGFTRQVMEQIATGGAQETATSGGASALQILYSEGNTSSAMAVSIIEQVLAGIDQEILARSGRFDAARSIPLMTTWVGSDAAEGSYVDFLLPGIVLMGFFMNGLFGIPGSILFSRDQGVLRRYWVTPHTVPRFFAGLTLGHLALCVVQFAILYSVGRFALGASVSFATAPAILFMLLAIVTFMAVGFLISSLSKTANAGMAVANILNMPMMFLSGLFFPIAGLPGFLRAIVYINPLSYLADGLRANIGVESAQFSPLLTVLIPIAWIAVATVIASWRLKWDVST